MNSVQEWAIRWGVSQQALDELFSHDESYSVVHDGMSETSVQQRVRLEGSKRGMRLWRNNVGAHKDKYGNFIRYGLANESKEMNKKIKSSDLIGITPYRVSVRDVGTILGVFTAVEVKQGDWKFKGDDHELAQQNFINLVRSMGGFATFANSEEALK